MSGKIFLAAALSILAQVSGGSKTYRGAVVEYHPVVSSGETNVRNYINFIKEAAAKRADIIVFPEGGLYSTDLSPIPDPNDMIVPCDSDFPATKAVKDLSCASKSNSIYSVINLKEKRKCLWVDDPNCPPAGFYTFNTNVVFDRSGMVIARYAKYNLFDEGTTNRPENPELSFFDTDFNVRFGTFICFDILFPSPAQRLVQQYQIKDFVFTSFWFGELPFLTALQMQRGWAEANNVNLLASGVNFPSSGSGGSGIYNGKFGDIVQIMTEQATSKLLIADIPKFEPYYYSNKNEMETHEVSKPYNNSVKVSGNGVTGTESGLQLLKDQMFRYESDIIDAGTTEKTVCSHNDFCCDFRVTMTVFKPEAKNYTYRAVAFNGVRRFGETFRGGVQSCGIVLCDGPHISNCTSRVKNIPGLFKFKEIRIKGSFKLRNSFQMPSTLTDGKVLRPLPSNQYEFTTKRSGLTSEVSLELLWPVDDLHTFAIWGRDFTRDNEPEAPVAGSSALLPIPFMFVSVIGFLVFAR